MHNSKNRLSKLTNKYTNNIYKKTGAKISHISNVNCVLLLRDGKRARDTPIQQISITITKVDAFVLLFNEKTQPKIVELTCRTSVHIHYIHIYKITYSHSKKHVWYIKEERITRNTKVK